MMTENSAPSLLTISWRRWARGLFLGLAVLAIPGMQVGGLAAAEVDHRVGAVVEKIIPGRLYVAYPHEIVSLDDVYPIERRARRKMNDLFGRYPGVRFGPVEYHIDFALGSDRVMTLDVAARIPAAAAAAIDLEREGLVLKETGVFHCLSLLHRGSPIDLGKSWEMLGKAAADGAVATGFNREVVIDHGGYIAADYLTELQLGIAD